MQQQKILQRMFRISIFAMLFGVTSVYAQSTTKDASGLTEQNKAGQMSPAGQNETTSVAPTSGGPGGSSSSSASGSSGTSGSSGSSGVSGSSASGAKEGAKDASGLTPENKAGGMSPTGQNETSSASPTSGGPGASNAPSSSGSSGASGSSSSGSSSGSSGSSSSGASGSTESMKDASGLTKENKAGKMSPTGQNETSSTAPTSGGSSGASAASSSDSKSGAGGKSLSKADEKMMREMAYSNLAEIETGKIALSQSKNEQVRSFAQKMIDDHTQAHKELEQLAQSKGVTLPTEPDKKHQAMAKKLSSLEGDKFDKQYMSKGGMQDHRDTHKLVQRAQKRATDPELKALADKMEPIISQHLTMAKDTTSSKGTASGSSGSSGASGSSSSK